MDALSQLGARNWKAAILAATTPLTAGYTLSFTVVSNCVGFAVLVTLWAMCYFCAVCLYCQHSGPVAASAFQIVLKSKQLQMSGINTLSMRALRTAITFLRIVTGMVHLEFFRYRSPKQSIGHAMRRFWSLIKRKHSVPVVIELGHPEPTTAEWTWRHVRQKSFFDSTLKGSHCDSPVIAWSGLRGVRSADAARSFILPMIQQGEIQ